MVHEYSRDDQWEGIKGLLPGMKGHVGRRAQMDTRLFIDALLWLCRSGGRWRDLPERFGKVHTIKMRYYHWVISGVFGPLFSPFCHKMQTQNGIYRIPQSFVLISMLPENDIKRGKNAEGTLVEAVVDFQPKSMPLVMVLETQQILLSPKDSAMISLKRSHG